MPKSLANLASVLELFADLKLPVICGVSLFENPIVCGPASTSTPPRGPTMLAVADIQNCSPFSLADLTCALCQTNNYTSRSPPGAAPTLYLKSVAKCEIVCELQIYGHNPVLYLNVRQDSVYCIIF